MVRGGPARSDPSGVRPAPGHGGSTARAIASVVALTALGWGVCWSLALLLDATTSVTVPFPARVVHACALAGVLTVAAAGTALRPVRAAHTVVAAAGAILAGNGTLALHGTAWGFTGLYSDAGFRTQAVTRFADSPALADYAYRGLFAYYPPALPWLEGRLAALTGTSGWAVMKPVELLLCALVPLLSWLLWRRVLPDLSAAVVAAAVSVATIVATKPDEWLVLVLALPWWLELARGARRPGVRPWPAAVHGLVVGLLLLFHTYFFVPLALASVLGVLVDLLLRRPVTQPPGRPSPSRRSAWSWRSPRGGRSRSSTCGACPRTTCNVAGVPSATCLRPSRAWAMPSPCWDWSGWSGSRAPCGAAGWPPVWPSPGSRHTRSWWGASTPSAGGWRCCRRRARTCASH